MKEVFSNCFSLKKLPDISKWNTNNVKDLSRMFENCISLLLLPDISKWEISNVENINKMFYNCSSLISYPDIAIWNISNFNQKNIDIFSPSYSSINPLSIHSIEKNIFDSNLSSNNDNCFKDIEILENKNINEFDKDVNEEYFENFYFY